MTDAAVVFAVGSANPVKQDAVRLGAAPFFPRFSIASAAVPSGVRAQPHGDAETITGAANRARAALSACAGGTYGVGLEGGVDVVAGIMYCFAWCAICDGAGNIGLASTGRCQLPPRVASLISQGMELGAADDLVFGRTDSRLGEGAVGLLTKGQIDRRRFYSPAVTMALARFLNPEIYGLT
jgi:inosine/xanthosine triphosphatase